MSHAITHALQTIDEANAKNSSQARRQPVGAAAVALGSLELLGSRTPRRALRAYRSDKVPDGDNRCRGIRRSVLGRLGAGSGRQLCQSSHDG